MVFSGKELSQKKVTLEGRVTLTREVSLKHEYPMLSNPSGRLISFRLVHLENTQSYNSLSSEPSWKTTLWRLSHS